MHPPAPPPADGRPVDAVPDPVPDPVPDAVRRLLRLAVLEHATERRRVFPPRVHVGVPGPGHPSLELAGEHLDTTLDHALRTDVLEAMLGRARRLARAHDPRRAAGGPLVWVTRGGDHREPHDLDLAWSAAARAAAAETGRALPMAVVTRHGWREPVSGAGQRWQRVRPRGT